MQFRSSVFLWRIHAIHARPLLFLYSQLLTLDFNLLQVKFVIVNIIVVLITLCGAINRFNAIHNVVLKINLLETVKHNKYVGHRLQGVL